MSEFQELGPHELADEVLALLVTILRDAYDSGQDGDPRSAFIYRHARNISDLGEDFLHLEAEGRTSAARIVVRPMIESLFRLAAAIKNPEFAAQKMVAELRDEVAKIKKWSLEDPQFGCMDDIIQGLTGLAETIKATTGLSTERNWTVYETAVTADLGQHYSREYFILSKYTHSTISGIVSQEYVVGRGHILQVAIFVMAAAAGNLVQGVKTTKAQEYLDAATEIIAATISLIEKGAFKAFDNLEGKSPPT